MIRRRLSRKVAYWLVAALVFAQAAMVANACLAAGSALVDAVAAASHEGCDMQERNLNLCLYHCADQYNNTGSLEVTVIAPAIVALPTAVWLAPLALQTETWSPVGRATGPPIPIRHCCFRI